MATFCLDCVAYDANGSQLENLTQLAVGSLAATVASVHFYCLPSVLTFGLVFSAFNVVVLWRSAASGADSLLAAMAAYSLGTTAAAAGLHLPLYSSPGAAYPRAVAACACAQDWLWLANTWTLVVACCERRASALSGRRRRRRQEQEQRQGQGGGGYCGRVQAALAAAMVAMVTLAAALPQLWAKEVRTDVESVGRLRNATVQRVGDSADALGPEYRVLYQTFRDIAGLLLPLPLLVAMATLLLCSGPGDKAEQESEHQRGLRHLCVTMATSYLMLAYPLSLLLFLRSLRLSFLLPAASFHPLQQLFSLLFYLYHPVAFPLHVCFVPDYRRRMRRVLCSANCGYRSYVVR